MTPGSFWRGAVSVWRRRLEYRAGRDETLRFVLGDLPQKRQSPSPPNTGVDRFSCDGKNGVRDSVVIVERRSGAERYVFSDIPAWSFFSVACASSAFDVAFDVAPRILRGKVSR